MSEPASPIVLVTSSDATLAGRLAARGLRARAHASDASDASADAAVVRVVEGLEAIDRAPAAARARTLAVVRASALADLAPVLDARRLAHWVALEDGAVVDDEALAARVVDLSGGYAARPSAEEALRVTRAEPREAVVARARAFAGASGASVAARVAAALEELVANGLRESPEVAIELARRGDSGVVVCVRDRAGRLDAATATAALARGFRGGNAASAPREGEGGGLGLFYVLGLAESLSVTSVARRSTEVIATFDRRIRFERAFDAFDVA